MLLKPADDKSKRVALLEGLQRSQLIGPTQRQWLREELLRFKKGIPGERDSAPYLDSYFKDGPNHLWPPEIPCQVGCNNRAAPGL